VIETTKGRRAFQVINVVILCIAALLCILPFLNLLSISLSSKLAASKGVIGFWPQEATLSSYIFIMRSAQFIRSFVIAIIRELLGVPINLAIILLTAYPLSKTREQFRWRNMYSWFFVFTMFFVPSLIPTYILVSSLHIMDTIWAITLPCAFPVFSMIVMLNFFRNLPKELEESATIDGAGHFRILTQIFIPTSLPSIATVTLFSVVMHWNSWFDGILYMNSPSNYPLQSYLQTIVVNPGQLLQTMMNDPEVYKILQSVSDQTTQAAQLFIAAIPMLLIYPFLQKYFITGLVLGSVKE